MVSKRALYIWCCSFFFNSTLNNHFFLFFLFFLQTEKDSSKMASCIDVASEQLCYIPCNFCNIVLAVSIDLSIFVPTYNFHVFYMNEHIRIQDLESVDFKYVRSYNYIDTHIYLNFNKKMGVQLNLQNLL